MPYVDAESLKRLLNTHEPTSAAAVPSASIGTDKAFRKIERLIKVRDRSVAETRSRLEQDQYDQADCEMAIARALRCGYLDDVRFADALVRSRLRAGKGIEGIVRELKGHHIDPISLLPGFPEAYLSQAPSQADAAYLLLCRKPPKAKNIQQAAYAKLMRNGYSSSVAAEATRRWLSGQNTGKRPLS